MAVASQICVHARGCLTLLKPKITISGINIELKYLI